MVVPGRLTDSLSAGCINLLYQGALPATSIEAVMEQIDIKGQKSLEGSLKKMKKNNLRGCKQTGKKSDGIGTGTKQTDIRPELAGVAAALSLEPKSAEQIAREAKMPLPDVQKMLTKLEMGDRAKEISPGYFVKCLNING